MKKQSPMQMRKESKPKADKPRKAPTAMERYAQEREKRMKNAPSPTVVELHDPQMDMHTLSRADEIRRNPTRHRAAKGAAKQQIKKLSGIAE